MRPLNPKYAIAIGFALVTMGVVLPLLMVRRAIEPSYILSFISWASTASGLFLGFIGSAMYIRAEKE